VPSRDCLYCHLLFTDGWWIGIKIKIRIKSKSGNRFARDRIFSRGQVRLFRHGLLKGQQRFRLDVEEPDPVGLERAQMRLRRLQSVLVKTHVGDDTVPS